MKLQLKSDKPNSETGVTPHKTTPPEENSPNIPKWKLAQQQKEKELHAQREREKTNKISKVNTIRKRIKEIGCDAVSNNTYDEDLQESPSPHHPNRNSTEVTTKGLHNKTLNILRVRSGSRSRNDVEPEKPINHPKEEELLAKIE